MSENHFKAAPIAAGAAILAASENLQASAIDELIAKLKSQDDNERGAAWQNAATAGSSAVKPLAVLMAHDNFETARCAKRALYKIVRHAGRPGAGSEANAVASELIPLLKSAAGPVQREILWMLSEIGGEEAIAPMAALLSSLEAREDARCALMRLPFPQAAASLKSAMANAPVEFKPALAESLRQLGYPVDGHPSQKLVPKCPIGETA